MPSSTYPGHARHEAQLAERGWNPTHDPYESHRYPVQPYRSPELVRAYRAASMARVGAMVARGDAAADWHTYRTARPLSAERRQARRSWRASEAASIRAAYLSEAVSRETVLMTLWGEW